MANVDKTNIILPVLEIKPIKQAIGHIYHVLADEVELRILAESDIENTEIYNTKLCELSDGNKIIITNRKSYKRPDGVNGVLQGIGNSEYRWLSHVLLDELNNDIDMKGLDVVSKENAKSWKDNFIFKTEVRNESGTVVIKGLRPPQIGGLHAVGAHWSLYKQPATIVMPTGTGKTETMIAALVAYMSTGTMLVVVPSKILRDQTAAKFFTLGLLGGLGNLKKGVKNPIVGIVKNKPKNISDLDIFSKCNVVIGTMSALWDSKSAEFTRIISEKVEALIVDEAHHIGAAGWSSFREYFIEKKVLQFTATPYRRDGKLVDGKVIYEYPLDAAQRDGYFKKIYFEPVYEIDQEAADQSIARAAINKLKKDEQVGFRHLVMARCSNTLRAEHIYGIYQKIAPELNPVLVHSDFSDSSDNLKLLRTGRSRVVVCVNMLGEGFDLPQLKIAAVHDTHKSLAVLLQFTGRFTRSSGISLGDATIIANIADQNVSSALERLYSEDANWNQLLSEFSSDASRAHAELVEFLNSSKRLDEQDENDTIEISHHLLRPMLSTLTYEARLFRPKDFYKGLPPNIHIHRVWLHEGSNTLYFVTKTEPAVNWTRSRDLRDRKWDLFVLHYDQSKGLLYLASSDHSSEFEKMAKAVGATDIISGDVIFRTLGHINRLIFQNVGVRKHGRRNLRYALYTGADVAEALSISERSGSVKSNLSGTGWEGGKHVSIGCSYKGRVWTREPGTIPEFVDWCSKVGTKLKDSTIDTTQIIANVLIPEEIDRLPNITPLSIEWPIELLHQSEDRIILMRDKDELPISLFDLQIIQYDASNNFLNFQIITEPEETWINLRFTVGGSDGFSTTRTSPSPVLIRIGKLTIPIDKFLSEYPPMIRFVDLSEMDGNLLIKPKNPRDMDFPDERFETWDWTGIDLTKESIWKNGVQRTDSIQWKASRNFIDGGFDVVVDDDGSGEAADIICLKEENDYLRLVLIHCKYTTGATAGARVKDVVEVCSQAVRSAKWKGEFRDLCRHISAREKRVSGTARATRFLAGRVSDLNKFIRLSRFKEIRPEIIIVQPGLSRKDYTAEQKAVLAAAYNYLKETIGVDLDIICNK